MGRSLSPVGINLTVDQPMHIHSRKRNRDFQLPNEKIEQDDLKLSNEGDSNYMKNVIDNGIIKLSKPINVTLMFESFPLWLFAMEPGCWNCITIVGFKSINEFSNFIDKESSAPLLGARVIRHLGLNKFAFSFHQDRSSTSLTLVSGGTSFINSVLPK